MPAGCEMQHIVAGMQQQAATQACSTDCCMLTFHRQHAHWLQHAACSMALTLQDAHPIDDTLGGCCHIGAGDVLAQVADDLEHGLADEIHPLAPVPQLKMLLQSGIAFAAEGNPGVCDEDRPCGTAAWQVVSMQGQHMVNLAEAAACTAKPISGGGWQTVDCSV
jgi:hypothetical protein